MMAPATAPAADQNVSRTKAASLNDAPNQSIVMMLFLGVPAAARSLTSSEYYRL
jgi:hypothetical protein